MKDQRVLACRLPDAWYLENHFFFCSLVSSPSKHKICEGWFRIEKGGKRTALVYFNRVGQHVPKHAHKPVALLHEAIGPLE